MIGDDEGGIAVGHPASKHTHPERFLDGGATPFTIGCGERPGAACVPGRSYGGQSHR